MNRSLAFPRVEVVLDCFWPQALLPELRDQGAGAVILQVRSISATLSATQGVVHW